MDKVDNLIELLAEDLIDILTNNKRLSGRYEVVTNTNALANLISARAQMKCFEVANEEV